MSTNSDSRPIFRISTLRNKEVLISESLNHLPLIRVCMIIICILIGIASFLDVIENYTKYRFTLKQTLFHRLVVPVILLLNILFHVSHYAHNIYDPAAYFEPKDLYSKIVIIEMELTFLFNIPLSIVFVIASRKLLSSCTIGQMRSINMLMLMTLYSLMSMVSGGHYIYEPPKNYSFICNLTIAGETLIAFILFVITLFVYWSNLTNTMGHVYSRITTDDFLNSNVQMSTIQQQQLKRKMSDDMTAENEL
ncbi:unnamed protein product [Didymodactylos carnosus]|uniref:Uncharacterized protein n=1 Tax=Didymodactylos carnosus TaxID=1234261 RepID=A0A814EEI4_9BILA|nr:unnamed protein product [Didymodactylos carnosus]CAF0968272.1 unnamed protein product [Didymodactylos carnosus]CAF3680700.1 unnamed protein product [Didymodactylos carnosus]CAF3741576.1 unnamed protein product [Didymodactylos carnosus]